MGSKGTDTTFLNKCYNIIKKEGVTTLFNKFFYKYAPGLFNPHYGIKNTILNTKTLFGHIKRSILIPLNVSYHNLIYNKKGDNPMEKDWDNLILLDACRYDTFQQVNWLEGKLDSTYSLASCTPDFLKNICENKQYHDTIYISANTHSRKYDQGTFFDVIQLDTNDWDTELNTVPPEVVTKEAIKKNNEYPNKRLIIHYIQPHTPWIGEEAQKFIKKNNLRGLKNPKDNNSYLMYALQHNVIDFRDDYIYDLYKENLKAVLKSVEVLMSDLSGKSVISSDHGELLGERTYPIPVRYYGHPPLQMKELRCVPWFTIEGERREITEEEPRRKKHIEHDTADERLEALGYK